MYLVEFLERGCDMALHKFKVTKPDGTTHTYIEKPSGKWDCAVLLTERDDAPMWISDLETDFMLGCVCAASDLGAKVEIEKGEDV